MSFCNKTTLQPINNIVFDHIHVTHWDFKQTLGQKEKQLQEFRSPWTCGAMSEVSQTLCGAQKYIIKCLNLKYVFKNVVIVFYIMELKIRNLRIIRKKISNGIIYWVWIFCVNMLKTVNTSYNFSITIKNLKQNLYFPKCGCRTFPDYIKYIFFKWKVCCMLVLEQGRNNRF